MLRQMQLKVRFPLGVFLLAGEKILALFFNLIGQLTFTDFYARGLEQKLNIVQLLFLPASFFAFVFSPLSKNTPNRKRAKGSEKLLKVRQVQKIALVFNFHV